MARFVEVSNGRKGLTTTSKECSEGGDRNGSPLDSKILRVRVSAGSGFVENSVRAINVQARKSRIQFPCISVCMRRSGGGGGAHRNIVSTNSRIRLNKMALLLTLPVPPCCIAAGCSPEKKLASRSDPSRQRRRLGSCQHLHGPGEISTRGSCSSSRSPATPDALVTRKFQRALRNYSTIAIEENGRNTPTLANSFNLSPTAHAKSFFAEDIPVVSLGSRAIERVLCSLLNCSPFNT